MEKRIVFSSYEIREMFFEKVLKNKNFSYWKEFSKYYKIPKSSLELYRNGKRTLPESTYAKLSSNLINNDKIFFNAKIRVIEENWGRIKGGKNNYLLNKSIFEKGREKAIKSSRNRMHKVDFNMRLTEDLAYFLGLFIGDGFTNKYRGSYLVQFTGDKKELLFYSNFFSNLSKNLFNLVPRIKENKKANFIRVNFYSRQLSELLTDRFGISAGYKSHMVLIPDEILNANKEILLSCVKGLYDAEGCVYLDKRKMYKKPYVRIELHMCNLGILKQSYYILKNIGIESVLKDYPGNLRLVIYGEEQVRKFIKEIGFNNPKQLKKLKEIGINSN